MTLQFDVEEFIRPLVSALYESSDEDMDVDTASTTVVNQSLVTNQHITGLAISASKLCGEASYVQHGDCTVCGKSYAMILCQDEMTLGYLEQTHESGETYAQRIRRRNAFEAGMRAACKILVPGGVSQAAACDGIFYQIPGNSPTNLPPGVLPI